ncbi:MAG: hypothetical protein PHT69_05475 [Bacteroidales bacterium]|nr:hypothetical protein [Bacteroidales bacterium]
MKKIFYFLASAAIIFAISSCNQQQGTTETTNQEGANTTQNTETSDRPANSNGKYLIEKGIIEFESEMMGMKQNMLMYIADYGEKSLVEVKGNFMGVKSHNLSLLVDGFMYEIDMITKKGTKKDASQINKAEDIDFTKLTEESMNELNLKKEGTEEFLGKTCDKYTIDNRSLNMKGSYLVWMGVPLKSEVRVAGLTVKMTAKKIDLETAIENSTFAIPEGIEITEL